LDQANFFLFLRLKRELIGLTFTQETLIKEWEGAVQTKAAEDFTEAFCQWYQCNEKCVTVGGGYVEKDRITNCPSCECKNEISFSQ
jgi:hypothetical protein